MASRPAFLTVLPPTASRNPADKCYFYHDEALASPVPFVMPYTAPFRVVQVAYNVQSTLFLLETGAVYAAKSHSRFYVD